MYQLPREFGSFNGLAVLCISVDCMRLGVMWRFSRLVVMGVLIVLMAYMYIFLDQRFTNHAHVASLPTVSLHFDTPFTQQDAPQCEPTFCNPVHVVNLLRCQVR